MSEEFFSRIHQVGYLFNQTINQPNRTIFGLISQKMSLVLSSYSSTVIDALLWVFNRDGRWDRDSMELQFRDHSTRLETGTRISLGRSGLGRPGTLNLIGLCVSIKAWHRGPGSLSRDWVRKFEKLSPPTSCPNESQTANLDNWDRDRPF